MVELFNSSLFKNFLIPFVAVGLSVFIKMNNRHDAIAWIKRDDFAVGFEMLLASIITFLLSSFSVGRKIAISMNDNEKFILLDRLIVTILVTFALFAGTVVLSFMVRRFGWNRQAGSEEKLTLWTGITIPFVFGFLSLIGAAVWAE